MKRIKTFESFNIYEGNEAGFMQRDPMVGMKDIVSQIVNKLNDISDQVMGKLAEITIPKNAIKKIEDLMMDTFGTLEPEMNLENAELLSKKLGLENLSVNESYKKGENLVVKALVIIERLLAMNFRFFTVPLTFILTKLMDKPLWAEIPAGILLSFALLFIFARLRRMFGYGYENPLSDRLKNVRYRQGYDIRDPSSERGSNFRKVKDYFSI